ncbi:MAG: YraN family protein [Candidatus Pacebacteria bacterium]|nr:YraN family protein [Candidatus Paceibacterota bacterium]MCF7862688.1 YraN family protein [Candidatus Paceibacterota bacterium]
MPKIFTSEAQKIGELGEKIAIKFLMKHDFLIKERNYTKKCGEIDIIAFKNNKLYFVEVKSSLKHQKKLSSGGNPGYSSEYNPADNVHYKKRRRLSKTIQMYLFENEIQNTNYQIDLIIVNIDIENRKGSIKVVKDIIL